MQSCCTLEKQLSNLGKNLEKNRKYRKKKDTPTESFFRCINENKTLWRAFKTLGEKFRTDTVQEYCKTCEWFIYKVRLMKDREEWKLKRESLQQF